MSGNKYHVFVYGTLKRGEPNSHFLENAEFVSEAITCEKYPLVIASQYNIPFALNSPGVGNYIHGEVYSVDDPTLARLDELENHPVLYERQEKPAKLADGTEMSTWIYLLNKYKPEMLKLELLESYSSTGAHGKKYVPRYARASVVDAATFLENL